MNRWMLGLWMVAGAAGAEFEGVLLDAACARTTRSATRLGQGDLSDAVRSPGRADRSTDMIPCQATTTTTAFGLRLDDGRILEFDQGGNDRLLVQIQGDPDFKSALAAVSGTAKDLTGQSDRSKTGADVTAGGQRRAPGTARRVAVTGKMVGEKLSPERVRLKQQPAEAPGKKR